MNWNVIRIERWGVKLHGPRPGYQITGFSIVLMVSMVGLTLVLLGILPAELRFLTVLPLYLMMTCLQFCDIFRAGHIMEPLWWIPFGVASYFVMSHRPDWIWTVLFPVFEGWKLIQIAILIRCGQYKGVFYERVRRSRGVSRYAPLGLCALMTLTFFCVLTLVV